MGGSAGVGAYSSPHAPSRTYHILQYIYILYTDFFGFVWFFLWDFLWDFLLIINMYSAIYMDDGDDMIGE